MNKLQRVILLGLIWTGAVAAASNSYSTLQIAPVEVAAGVELPIELRGALDDLTEQLTRSRVFQQVIPLEDGNSVHPDLHLITTTARFGKGSGAMGYAMGMSAGESQAKGIVAAGPFGGGSEGVTRGLAKSVAKEARTQFRARKQVAV